MKNIIEYGSLFDIYQSLFEFNHDACYALDKEGKFVLCNDSFVEMTGYSEKEALQMTYFSLIMEDCSEKTFYHFQKMLKGNREKFKTSIRHKNGERVDVAVTGVPLYRDGEIQGIVGMAKNVTERNKLAELLKGQNKILELVTKGADFTNVLEHILYLVEQVSDGVYGTIHLLDNNTSFLRCGAAPSLPDEYKHFIKEIPIGPSSGSCGTAAYQKESILVTDIANDPLWEEYKEAALKHGLKAAWSSPVFDNQNSVLGVLAIYYDKVCTPTKWDRKVVKEATYLTSLVIQHFRSEEKINYLAFHDDLTGLPNRRMFNEKLTEAITHYTNHSTEMFGIMYLDLDRFKLINDTLGHSIGNLLLKEVANRIKGCVNEAALVSRQGGDEFTILLQDVYQPELKVMAEEIINALAKPYYLGDQEVFVTPSIGISIYPSDGSNGEELLRKADIAMYQAKKEGRNNFQFYNPILSQKTFKRLEIENELRKALKKNEFELYYQPIIDLSSKKLASVEALIRWEHPSLGTISPAQFIPIAEETGTIVRIGEWVLWTACRQFVKWKKAGLHIPFISVNISIRQFYQTDLIPLISRIIKDTGIEPACLTIEITESMTMDVKRALNIIHNLKNLGVNISMDDFGTGYSSLNCLKNFPIDYLKIDQTFIQDINKSKSDEKITTTILLMAQNLGLQVIAEGVETIDQLRFLTEHSCNMAQGYFFSIPLSAEELSSHKLAKV